MIEEAERGNLKALVVMGENPLRALPEPERVLRAFERLEFLLVIDILTTETARMAHVALPGAAFSEKEGSFTSMEGRIQRFKPAVSPPGEARADWMILDALAGAMAGGKPYGSLQAVQREVARHVPAYGGLAEAKDRTWVRGAGAEALLGSEGRAGRIPFSNVARLEIETPDGAYPLTAVLGSERFHLGGGTRTSRSARIRELPARGRAAVSPEDADTWGLNDGGRVRISSSAGSIERRIRVDNDLNRGLIFIPAAFHGNDARNLLPLIDFEDPGFPGWNTCPVRIEKTED
jgi:predicted molibdopterin-dependent oxidoreductase YjgC